MMHQRLAVGKTVRVGDLARVWDGKRWLDGRVRSVGHATTPGGCEVEIKYAECGCVGIQRGQCRHRFIESDCGRLWVRDCPALRRQRHHHQQQAAAAHETASSARVSSTSTSTTPAWPTAKFHQHLKRKQKREDEDDEERRASNLPIRWRNASDERGGCVIKKRNSKVQLGRGLPEWRLNGNERHRDLQHCQPELATNHTLAFYQSASSEPSRNNHTITTDTPLSPTPTLKPTDDDAEADDDVCGGQADNQPRGNVVDAQDRNQNQWLGPRQEAAGRRQQESVDGRERTKQCKNRRRKELRRQMMKETKEERASISAATAVESGSRVVSLAAYEWVRIESRGVLWVEEGPARLVLRPGERITSGPHQRLDLPTAAVTPFFWSGSGVLCV